MGKSGNSVMAPVRVHSQGGMTHGQPSTGCTNAEIERLRTSLRHLVNKYAGKNVRIRNRVLTALQDKKSVGNSDVVFMTNAMPLDDRNMAREKFERWNTLTTTTTKPKGVRAS